MSISKINDLFPDGINKDLFLSTDDMNMTILNYAILF